MTPPRAGVAESEDMRAERDIPPTWEERQTAVETPFSLDAEIWFGGEGESDHSGRARQSKAGLEARVPLPDVELRNLRKRPDGEASVDGAPPSQGSEVSYGLIDAGHMWAGLSDSQEHYQLGSTIGDEQIEIALYECKDSNAIDRAWLSAVEGELGASERDLVPPMGGAHVHRPTGATHLEKGDDEAEAGGDRGEGVV